MSQSPSEAVPASPASTAAAESPAPPRLRVPARPWVRGVPALLAVACAGFAEHLAADARVAGLGGPPAASWLLFGLAAVLFLPAVWPVPDLRPAVPPALGATWQAL